MFVNHLSEEELAKVFAHFIYRDDSIVEYYHCKNVIMDQEVYAAVLGAVLSNLRRIARNHKVLILTEGEAISAVKKMYPTRAMEFFKYEKTFASYSTHLPGSNWDAPVFLEMQPPKDKATYILDGAFREGCVLHWHFDDKAMCRINKDVYNRIYTLVRLHLLP